MKQEETLILVNEYDEMVGTMEKIRVHQLGLLHRAFSVFLLNHKYDMLLQLRAHDKYHSGGLWTNACCSHPRPGESTIDAAHRRLQEELGTDCPLQELFTFTYRVKLPNGLIEYELDHVFIGFHEGPFMPNQKEIDEIKFFSLDDIQQQINMHPHQFTYWFRLAFPEIKNNMNEIQLMVSP